MTEWVELYKQHQALRTAGKRAVSELRQVLKLREESPGSIFEADIAARLQQHNNKASGVSAYGFQADGESLSTWNHPDWDSPGHGKIHLEDARLHIHVVLNRQDRLQEVNLLISGKRRGSDMPLAIAVHLPDDRTTEKADGDRQGFGACGHAALHCHIGPTLDALPKIRVPLPPLRPARALEWMLSQVVPTYETAPWSAVKAALKLPP